MAHEKSEEDDKQLTDEEKKAADQKDEEDGYTVVYTPRIWHRYAKRYIYPKKGTVFRLRFKKARACRKTRAQRPAPRTSRKPRAARTPVK